MDLIDTGRVHAVARGADAAAAMAGLPEAIAYADRRARQESPGVAPPLSIPAAAWAATIFYHACRFLVYREFEPGIVVATLKTECPLPPGPSTAYSVDLTMRYLPDLVSLATGIAENDPLVEGLMLIARRWPLSSVGISIPTGVDASAFIEDRCLRTVYAERILARGDVSRLTSPAVRQVVREAIGMHGERWPAVWAAVSSSD